ncbi:MAG: PAS domain-containing sensor histidine kinase, partial [Candidatus Omnitrophota bacterium]
DAIMIRDMESYQTVDVNKAACEMFGYTREDMIGLYIRNFMTTQVPYSWEYARHFYEAAAAGEPQLFEWLAVGKTGRLFWVEATIKRIMIGGQYRLMSIVRDITERKRLANMKDNFMNSVSHELRTPLAAIKEGVSIVLEEIMGKLGKENKKILNVVKKNVDRLSRIVSDVLDFQKLESGSVVLNPKMHDMNSVIMECYRTMSVVASEKKLDFFTDLDKKIPKLLFDKDKIIQVLMNLIDNAMKFTRKGDITISTKAQGNTVKISVVDTGVGIKEDDLPKLFEKFGQIDSRAESKTGGTGLGLAISKEIIEKHKGKIWAESELGKGSVFSFTLPVKKRKG